MVDFCDPSGRAGMAPVLAKTVPAPGRAAVTLPDRGELGDTSPALRTGRCPRPASPHVRPQLRTLRPGDAPYRRPGVSPVNLLGGRLTRPAGRPVSKGDRSPVGRVGLRAGAHPMVSLHSDYNGTMK